MSNEIILSKSTEDTVMELDGEGAANYEQLKDLIRKECDKRDHCYAQLKEKYNKLEHDITHPKQQKTMTQRGCTALSNQAGTSKKNKSDQKPASTQ